MLGGCLIAYGSDTYKGCSAIFKLTLSREEAEIVVGVYKLAVRMSIGPSFIGVMLGLILCLEVAVAVMVGYGGNHTGVALALISTLYGLVYAFCFFLPLQYYFQHQLDKDS